MTNGRGAGMAFMIKKKKYKFQVEFCLEELLEVPFVSAVLFAKLRLLDGGFQDHSTRVEVAEHAVKWGSRFSFSCKMLANASTGILEPCILRISVRKECKGGRSFTKLGFVDLNLAEFAGAGETSRKALLEGYDNRRRQDNSMLRFSIKMNMLSGDILFKVPSPSLKHKPVATEDSSTEPRPLDDYSSGSLAGSIASASSGFGSLPKKRPALLTSELIIGQPQNEHVPVTIALDGNEGSLNLPEMEDPVCEQGHSRNSSNTSQMSKASGYSSIHSHSRQSSSGDSGHIRNPHKTKWFFNPSSKPLIQATRKYYANRSKDIFSTPKGATVPPTLNVHANHSTPYYTPKGFQTQSSNVSSSSAEEYKTPEVTVTDVTFPLHYNHNKLNNRPNLCTCNLNDCQKNSIPISETMTDHNFIKHFKEIYSSRYSLYESELDVNPSYGVLRSKSDFEIPHNKSPSSPSRGFFKGFDKSNVLFSFLTPSPIRKNIRHQNTGITLSPSKCGSSTNNHIKVPNPLHNNYPQRSLPGTRNSSPTLLKPRLGASEGQHTNFGQMNRGLPHRKLLEGSSGGKLAPVAISPDETSTTVFDCSQNQPIRRPSVTTNPSSSSLVLSETGSLDRAKAALERRKKAQAQETDLNTVSGRVEVTRVNPDHLIAELLKNTNLEQPDDSAETSGLQLFIAKDGTAALGNPEVKSQMSTGVQAFKQVVMEDKR